MCEVAVWRVNVCEEAKIFLSRSGRAGCEKKVLKKEKKKK